MSKKRQKTKKKWGSDMKTTGIVRGIDEVGRIVIPKEYRRMLKVNDKEDALEISMEGDRIVLRKHMPACTFCGSSDGMIEYAGYKICRHCVDNLDKIIGQQVEGE
jgi:transcriptional pleiotropic regulator of transition state genes